jgi:hypothetical protein
MRKPIGRAERWHDSRLPNLSGEEPTGASFGPLWPYVSLSRKSLTIMSLFCRFAFGDMTLDEALRPIEPLASDVIPTLRKPNDA